MREQWRNRIVRYSEEAPDQLLAHPSNFRIHPTTQQKALEGAINDLGYLAPVICNERTQHVLDGHLRISLALRRDEPTIPVVWVDLPEELEAEALLTIDPIAALAAADKANLDSLLREVETGDAAVQQLLANLAADSGLDAVQSREVESFDVNPNLVYNIIITCVDDDHQRELLESLTAQGLQCKAAIT